MMPYSRLVAAVSLVMASQSLLAQSDAPTCAVTRPNGQGTYLEQASPDLHGNGALRVGFGDFPNGVLVFPGTVGAVLIDGTLRWPKVQWRRGVRGQLTITGRRLDGDAPPLRAEIPSGYGDTGLQPTALAFPSAGCWEIAGRVGTSTLTFTLNVVKP
jgi:hypothetical protein